MEVAKPNLGKTLTQVLDLAPNDGKLPLPVQAPLLQALREPVHRAAAHRQGQSADRGTECGAGYGHLVPPRLGRSARPSRAQLRCPPVSAGAACTAPPCVSASCTTGSSGRPGTPRSRAQPFARLRGQAESQIKLADRGRGCLRGRLLQLSLFRRRRLPARLQLPASAAVGLCAGRRQRRATTSSSPARVSSPSPSSGPARSSTTKARATGSTRSISISAQTISRTHELVTRP
jgi:hypothetical protein